MALVSLLATGALLAACSGGSDKSTPPVHHTTAPSTAPTTAPATTTTPPSVRRWALTGLPVHGPLPQHPVYIVKIDNTSSSRPQLGLDDADMVVEELVEGGLTRLAAFYYSTIPPRVGPVRSMRASDIGISEPANAFLVASGAAGKTMMLLNEAGIDRVTEGAAGFYRSTRRYAPYNLMMYLPALAKHVSRAWGRPGGQYLPFGPPAAFHGTIPVHSATVRFSGASTDNWVLRGAHWYRTNSYSQPGRDFPASNVLILRVQVGNAGYLDPAGNPVPETFFYGHGGATLIHGDHAEHGIWHKDGTSGRVRLTSGGKPMTVPYGHTFIELLPDDGGVVTLHR